MFQKATKKKLGVIDKTEVLLRFLYDRDSLDDFCARLSARQMQELRDFLENQVAFFSARQDENPQKIEDIKQRYEPIPNYYHKQYCREPMDACFAETCLSSNPSCFSKKMRLQLQVLINQLDHYVQINGILS